MKPVLSSKSSEDVISKPLTRRALAKQKTRAKVLAAARALFSEAGYEGATIRDIANAAGMSTGAVFANFVDKSDLFNEIVASDIVLVIAAMQEAGAKGKDVEDAILQMFSAGYAFYQKQLPLARAGFSVSWAPDGGALRNSSPAIRRIIELMGDRLAAATADGELKQDANLQLRADMLWDAYLSNYPSAIFHGWSLEALETRAREQIKIILAGARRG